jgi:hypothetical protein
MDECQQGDDALRALMGSKLQTLVGDVVMDPVQFLAGNAINRVYAGSMIQEGELVVVYSGIFCDNAFEVGLVC